MHFKLLWRHFLFDTDISTLSVISCKLTKKSTHIHHIHCFFQELRIHQARFSPLWQLVQVARLCK